MANPSIQLGTNSNWAIKEDKLLAYKEYNDYFFNKEFDFSRGTSATYVGRDGLIKTAGIQPNIVTNGDFATDSDWTKGSGWSISGGKAIGSATGASLYQADGANYTSGKLYKITFEVSDYVSGSVRPEITNVAGSYVSSNGVFVQYITATSSPIGAELKGSTFTGSVDNFTVQEIQTDTPRIDFTNDTKGHLLLEPSRTNYVTYSNDISQFTTLAVGGTLTETANYAEAPNGENEATRLQMSASGSNYALKGIVTSAFNDDYYISIYLKSNTSENQQVTIYGRNSLTQSYTVTTQWQRFEVSCNNASGSAFFYFGSRPSYSSDENLDILAWGGQLEQGDYSTSLINTTGAASTRNADVCNNSGSAQDFNSEEGVLYAEIEGFISTDTVDQNRYITVTNGTSNERVALLLGANPNQLRAIVYSNTQSINLSFTTSLTDVKQFNKLAVKYKSGDYGFFLNGTKIGSSSETSIFTANTLNDISFDVGGGTQQFRGKVRNVQVFTEALTDAELQELTS